MGNVRDRELYSVEDLAQLLSLAQRTIWVMVKQGQLPKPHRLPGGSRLVRWRRIDIEHYLEEVLQNPREIGPVEKKEAPEKKKS